MTTQPPPTPDDLSSLPADAPLATEAVIAATAALAVAALADYAAATAVIAGLWGARLPPAAAAEVVVLWMGASAAAEGRLCRALLWLPDGEDQRVAGGLPDDDWARRVLLTRWLDDLLGTLAPPAAASAAALTALEAQWLAAHAAD